MRAIICGSHRFTDSTWLYKRLDQLHRELGFDVVIEGDAPGVDRMAGFWARRKRLDNLKFPADWDKYGLAAGPIRNSKMLKEGQPDIVIAFPGPGSKGTHDMADKARAAGVRVIEVDYV